MKITQVTFKRILNVGNYNSAHMEMTATVEEGEDPERVARQLMATTDQLLANRYLPKSDDDNIPY